MTAATVATALALGLFAIAREPAVGLIACLLAGISWVAAIVTLNVSAQFAPPGWVRGRGMAMFATAQFAGLAVGSVVWGQAAQVIGLPAVHIIAAIALVASIPLLRRWRLQTAAGLDLAPSMHWPAPLLSHDIEPDRGPVLVTIEYVVPPLIVRHFSRRCRSWRASAGATALLTGASTKTPQKRVPSSRHSASIPGSSTCDSINA